MSWHDVFFRLVTEGKEERERKRARPPREAFSRAFFPAAAALVETGPSLPPFRHYPLPRFPSRELTLREQSRQNLLARQEINTGCSALLQVSHIT